MRLVFLACALMFAEATIALAAEPAERAADLYDQGASAYEAGDYNRALHALHEADRIAPNDVTLSLALRAALRGSLPVLAMRAALEAEQRGGELRDLAREVRARFASEVGFLVVRCSVCDPSIDSLPTSPGETRPVAPGSHRIEASVRGVTKTYDVIVAPGQSSDILVDEIVPSAREVPPHMADLDLSKPASTPNDSSRVPFWVGLGVSAALGVGTGLSALDTRERYQSFRSAPSMAGAEAGERSQLRTNLLFGATVISSLATTLVGVLLLPQRDEPKPRAHGHGAR
jgi:hypothetical protein